MKAGFHFQSRNFVTSEGFKLPIPLTFDVIIHMSSEQDLTSILSVEEVSHIASKAYDSEVS
jgi:hypothetical protein